ncbi:hypothetical protein, variant 3 [Aphanomyces invadans]|uniref:Uncharacterized protein n=2 Tax=Aphanomyces invadans TaxID=157072 RepID=A0A024TNV6_9STRA|nr:hypothetical protein, variant 3 [Aphanomyces invadans]ETV95017.1 hypothetical protein, variant 3 [Aphanomyces invadans]|eukprot:XP_008876188.1 hypothetical protein, variant 3 [Aphanomyces invadans]
MSRCLTVHRHMEVAAIHAKKARTALESVGDVDHHVSIVPSSAPVTAGSPDSTDAPITLKLFQTESSDTLPCVHTLIQAHYRSMRSLRQVLVPPPPALPLQFEGLSSKQIEQLTGPIRDVCETLTTRDFSMVPPTAANVHLMGPDVFYVSLYHGETMMMGIFFMPPNSVIPLHDHPYMSVVSRVYVPRSFSPSIVLTSSSARTTKGVWIDRPSRRFTIISHRQHALLVRRSRDKYLEGAFPQCPGLT